MLMCLFIRRSPFVYSSERHSALPSFLGRRRQTQPVGMSQRSATLSTMRNLGLLLENRWRTADTAPLESNIYLYAIGDLDERNTARHSVLFPIKSHGAVETPGGRSFAIARES